MTLKDYLKTHRLLTDGAMGTYYSLLHPKELNPMPEYGVITNPDQIVKIHKEYLRAGAMLLRTNTFAANQITLQISDAERSKMIQTAIRLAKQAIREYEDETAKNSATPFSAIRPFLAGDIGPVPGMISGTAEEEQESAIWREYLKIADIFISEGVDAIICETFPEEQTPLKIAQYVKENAPGMFMITEVALQQNGYTGNGLSAARVLERMALHPATDACGFNCGIGAGHMLNVVRSLKLPKETYFAAIPNAGYPEQLQNRMVFVNNAKYFADQTLHLCEAGVDILGACCGSTPEYIEILNRQLLEKNYILREKEPQGIASCFKELQKEKREEPGDTSVSYIKERNRQEKQESNNAFEKPDTLGMNTFSKKLLSGEKVIACELDPPYDANDRKIIEAAELLKKCGVDMITLADSPMGRSRIDSVLMACKLHRLTGMPVMPHICCRDRNMISMRSTLLGAYVNDIRNLLLVTGDPVPQDVRTRTTGVFDYHSIQLMNYVKEMNQEQFAEESFFYGGALNYNSPNLEKLIERMEQKLEAGAQFFLSQPVYSEWDIERIAEIKHRVSAKILCGIMPLTSYTNANFIKNEIAGIDIPDEILARYRKDMSKEEAEQTGACIAEEIIHKLEGIADGYYMMLQFNRASFMEKIRFELT